MISPALDATLELVQIILLVALIVGLINELVRPEESEE